MFGFHHATEVRIGASSDETAALGTDNLDEEPRKSVSPTRVVAMYCLPGRDLGPGSL